MYSQAPPERALEQRLNALARANAIREARAELKRRLKRRELDVVDDVLAEPPLEADTMKARDLLRAAPKIGNVKANRLLSQARVSPSKTVGGLTERQRRELAELVPACARRAA